MSHGPGCNCKALPLTHPNIPVNLPLLYQREGTISCRTARGVFHDSCHIQELDQDAGDWADSRAVNLIHTTASHKRNCTRQMVTLWACRYHMIFTLLKKKITCSPQRFYNLHMMYDNLWRGEKLPLSLKYMTKNTLFLEKDHESEPYSTLED